MPGGAGPWPWAEGAGGPGPEELPPKASARTLRSEPQRWPRAGALGSGRLVTWLPRTESSLDAERCGSHVGTRGDTWGQPGEGQLASVSLLKGTPPPSTWLSSLSYVFELNTF